MLGNKPHQNYGLKQQLVIFSQTFVFWLSLAGSFHMSYLNRLCSDGLWDWSHLNSWLGWTERWLTQCESNVKSTGLVNQRTHASPLNGLDFSQHGGWILKQIVSKANIIRSLGTAVKPFLNLPWNYSNIIFTVEKSSKSLMQGEIKSSPALYVRSSMYKTQEINWWHYFFSLTATRG